MSIFKALARDFKRRMLSEVNSEIDDLKKKWEAQNNIADDIRALKAKYNIDSESSLVDYITRKQIEIDNLKRDLETLAKGKK